MTKTSQAPTVYPAELVFGAACAAQRINGEYIKGVQWPDSPAPDAKQNNRKLMTNFLADPSNVTEDDMEQGRQVRQYFQALTFKILAGKKLSEFDSNAMSLSNRDELSTNYELAVVCSFPSSYLRGKARDTVDNRVKFAAGGFVGRVGDKVNLTIEVLRSFYSQQWGVYYVTAITPDDQALFFSMKQPPANNAVVKINGTVKAHRDNQTQLNRVKITQ